MTGLHYLKKKLKLQSNLELFRLLFKYRQMGDILWVIFNKLLQWGDTLF